MSITYGTIEVNDAIFQKSRKQVYFASTVEISIVPCWIDACCRCQKRSSGCCIGLYSTNGEPKRQNISIAQIAAKRNDPSIFRSACILSGVFFSLKVERRGM
jgi:hypothetical protein